MNKVIEEAAQEAADALKKLRAAKGELQGNFYFAVDAQGKQAGLVVTLQARDPKGEKAVTRGKLLRGELKGAKFARGLVLLDGNTLIFELHAGSASASHVKTGFKKSLAELPGLGLLKKARVRTPDGEEDEEEEEGTATSADAATPETATGAVEEEEADLSTLDPDELQELIAAQKELGALTTSLKDFLSQDAAADELGEQLAEHLTSIQQLTQATPRDEAALAAARRELAAMVCTGPEPFPEVGQPIPPALHAVLTGAIDGAVAALTRYLTRAIGEIESLHEQTRAIRGPEDLDENQRKTMLAALERSTSAVVSYREQLRTNLVSALNE